MDAAETLPRINDKRMKGLLPDLKTDASKAATWKGVPMMITAGKGLSGERAFPVDAPSKLSRCP